jgi:hypothetical protein
MTTKSLFAVGALTLASFGIARAKSYDITLSSPAKAGTTELKAGAYRVKVEGSQAVFTNEESQKSVTVPVTIQHSGQKASETSVQIHSNNGVDTIHEISLGGSDTKVELSE